MSCFHILPPSSLYGIYFLCLCWQSHCSSFHITFPLLLPNWQVTRAPFFNLNYSHQEEKQRDGDGCQVRAEGIGQGGSFSRVWGSWAQQCSHPLLAVGSKLLMSSQYNPAGFIDWKWGILPQWNVAGPFRYTHCDSATFVLGQFIHYFATQPHALGHDTGNFLHVQMHFNFSFAQDSNADHLWLTIKLEVKVSGW